VRSFLSINSVLNAKNSALALGATAAAKSTLELAAGFDDAMAKVQVATGITDRQSDSYKKLEAAAREVGGATKFSATEAADGLASLSQAGLDADAAITALPAVAQAAQVNNVALAESAETVTVAMNAFGLSAQDATKIIDVQTTAAAAGILDFNDFKQAIAAVGSVAHLSNQSLEETTSALIALTNNGQSASDAGTSIKSALLALTKPTDAARAAMDELGLSVYDSSGKMKPFSDILPRSKKALRA
jgi:TP901 family phage tail tape measure protein